MKCVHDGDCASEEIGKKIMREIIKILDVEIIRAIVTIIQIKVWLLF